jgi:predicted enzyme related to lactoylglutathione lyase
MSEATATIDATTTTATTTPAGTYVWQDLFTTDPKAAEAFYGELFGWTVKPMTMPEADWTYDLLENQGQGFGGCMPLFPGQGDAARWIPYISVPNDDVDAAAERAAAAGGIVAQQPEDIPTVGRFATVLDPDGTATNPFAPITPEGGVPPERQGMPPLGGISWNEIWVNDLTRGRDFYASVYGWSIDDANMGGDMQYYICNSADGPMRGGFGSTQGRMSPVAVFYVHVADLEATIAKLTELGGTTEGPTMEVPEIGRMQWARDPQGAQFCLHEDVKR